MGDLSEHFSRQEFACPDGCGGDTIDTETLDVLETIREHFNAPVHVNSGFRCLRHNAAIGGRTYSQHLVGRAADIWVEGVSPGVVQEYVKTLLAGSGGLGRYNTFTHVDTRTNGPARWDERTTGATGV